MLIVENNRIKEIEPFDPNIEMPQSWSLGDDPPYQAFVRYSVENGWVWMIQIYVKSTERRKGLGKKLIKYLEKKGKVKIETTANDKEVFGKFLKKLGYKPKDGWYMK